ncbi:MAG: hypothetical protein LH629_05590, partial [Ignavibacteria bacterium]|nr:hypothetical protein [Ignavibacteria bacterium]
MRAEEIEIIIALNNIDFSNADFDRKFVKTIYQFINAEPEVELSDEQRTWLFKLLNKYKSEVPEVFIKYKQP